MSFIFFFIFHNSDLEIDQILFKNLLFEKHFNCEIIKKLSFQSINFICSINLFQLFLVVNGIQKNISLLNFLTTRTGLENWLHFQKDSTHKLTQIEKFQICYSLKYAHLFFSNFFFLIFHLSKSFISTKFLFHKFYLFYIKKLK